MKSEIVILFSSAATSDFLFLPLFAPTLAVGEGEGLVMEVVGGD